MADNYSRDRYKKNDASDDIEAEEDPLVELARIVSEDGGFYKPRRQKDKPADSPDTHQDAFSPELEAELIQELEESFSPGHDELDQDNSSMDRTDHRLRYEEDDARSAGDQDSYTEQEFSDPPVPGNYAPRDLDEQEGGIHQPSHADNEPQYDDQLAEIDEIDLEAELSDETQNFHGLESERQVTYSDRLEPRFEMSSPGQGTDDDIRDEYDSGDERQDDDSFEEYANYRIDPTRDAGMSGASESEVWDEADVNESALRNDAPEPSVGDNLDPDFRRALEDVDEYERSSGLEGNEGWDTSPPFTIERPNLNIGEGHPAERELRAELENEDPFALHPEDDGASYRDDRYDEEVDYPEDVDDAAIGTPHGLGPGPAEFEEQPRSRKGLMAVAAVLALVVLGGGVAVVLGLMGDGNTQTGEPVIVRADRTPVKEMPAGASADTADGTGQAVFDRVAGRPAKTEEKLVDSSETPKEVARIILPDSQSGETVPVVGIEGLSGSGSEDKIEARISDDTTPPVSVPKYDPIGPKKVRTVIVRPDGTIVSSPAPSNENENLPQSGSEPSPSPSRATASDAVGEGAAGGTSRPRPSAVRTVSVTPEPAASGAPSRPLGQIGEPASSAGAPARVTVVPTRPVTLPGDDNARSATVAPATQSQSQILGLSAGAAIPKPRPDRGSALAPRRIAAQPAAPVTSQRNSAENPGGPTNLLAAAPPASQPAAAALPPRSSAGGQYVVQVSSQRSQEAAQATYRTLQRQYPSVLGPYSADIQRAQVQDRGVFYRVRVGPFAARSEAVDLCNQLKASGGSCFVP